MKPKDSVAIKGRFTRKTKISDGLFRKSLEVAKTAVQSESPYAFDPKNRDRVFRAMGALEKKLGYPATVRVIADRVSLSRTATHWHMRKLLIEGKVWRQAQWPKLYTVKEQ